MKTIEDLLKNLARPEVLEFGLVTNRLPSVNIGGKFEPVDDEAPSTEVLLEMLVAMGGSRHIEGLSDKPVQWTTRLDGVGVVAVAAIMRKDIVQARFTVARRDPAPSRSVAPKPQPAAPAAAAPAAPPVAPAGSTSSQQRAAFRPSTAPLGGAGQRVMPVTTSQMQMPAVQGTPTRPSSAPMPAASPRSSGSVPAAAPARSSGAVQVVPPSAKPEPPEFDDDDEPTVQTLSPPVSPMMRGATDEKARAEAELAAKEAARLAKEYAEAESAAAERKAEAEKKAEAERKAEAEKKAEAERKAEAEKKAAAERKAEAEKKAAAEPTEEARNAENERIAVAKAKEAGARMATIPQRARINTPTNVDAVDVEITTTDSGAGAARIRVEADAHGSEVTVAFSEDVNETSAAAMSVPVPVGANAPSPPAPPVSPSAVPPADKEKRSAGSLDAFLGMAVAAKATDLHIIAGRPLTLRIAGDLVARTPAVPSEHIDKIVREIVPVRLRETIDRDGTCEFSVEHPEHGRFRVSVSRQRSGHKVVMRVIPKEIPTNAALGLPELAVTATKLRHGLVLATGPLGSGKTTTVASLVDQINRERACHILTIEEPLELVYAKRRGIVSQRDVGATARTFTGALRAAMRADPDVIVIGEVRDLETLRGAVDAAEAGHLVFTTLAAPSVTKAVRRLAESYPLEEQPRACARIASVLKMVIGQRLVPNADHTRVHAAFEVLPTSLGLTALVREGRFTEIAVGPRGRRLDDALADLVRAKKVTLEVAKSWAEGDLGLVEGKP